MTYTLIWRNEARQALSRLRSADPVSAKLAVAAVRALAAEPYPRHQQPTRRLPLPASSARRPGGTYDVDEDQRTVQVYLVGQLPPARRR